MDQCYDLRLSYWASEELNYIQQSQLIVYMWNRQTMIINCIDYISLKVDKSPLVTSYDQLYLSHYFISINFYKKVS